MDNVENRATQRFHTLFTNGTTLDPIWTDAGSSLSQQEVFTKKNLSLSSSGVACAKTSSPECHWCSTQCSQQRYRSCKNGQKCWVVHHQQKKKVLVDWMFGNHIEILCTLWTRLVPKPIPGKHRTAVGQVLNYFRELGQTATFQKCTVSSTSELCNQRKLWLQSM